MRGFGIGSSRTDKSSSTNLTSEVIQDLDLTTQHSVANDPPNRALHAPRCRIPEEMVSSASPAATYDAGVCRTRLNRQTLIPAAPF
jgi:hypothetical protein